MRNSAFAPSPASITSPWHSPVPYLFGGLAAMLGLIALALLILACSYWRLAADNDSSSAAAGGDGGENAAPPPEPAALEEKFVVIMAGQEKPTFIGTPISSSRTSSFGSNSSSSGCTACNSDGEKQTAV